MLLTTLRTPLAAGEFVRRAGTVFAVFDEHTQDSGNVSYGVATSAGRFFIKTAGGESSASQLTHESRISLLRNAIALHRDVSHPVLAALRNVVECRDCPALVFDWVAGELVGAPRSERLNPHSAFRRFRRLDPLRIFGVLDGIIDLHAVLVAKGWIAVDFYDGSLLYDFATGAFHVVDLDHYHRGPFLNPMGRMFGSTRFMAPEEFQRGAMIDERTTVFLLGRTVQELLSDHSAEALPRAATALDVSRRACQPDPDERFPSVAAFRTAWAEARS